MIDVGDKVVAVNSKHSTCAHHCEEVLGPDPHPEMTGRVFTVVGIATRARDLGCTEAGLFLDEKEGLWCGGCFRKLEKADENFITQFKVKEPA